MLYVFLQHQLKLLSGITCCNSWTPGRPAGAPSMSWNTSVRSCCVCGSSRGLTPCSKDCGIVRVLHSWLQKGTAATPLLLCCSACLVVLPQPAHDGDGQSAVHIAKRCPSVGWHAAVAVSRHLAGYCTARLSSARRINGERPRAAFYRCPFKGIVGTRGCCSLKRNRRSSAVHLGVAMSCWHAHVTLALHLTCTRQELQAVRYVHVNVVVHSQRQ